MLLLIVRTHECNLDLSKLVLEPTTKVHYFNLNLYRETSREDSPTPPTHNIIVGLKFVRTYVWYTTES